MIEYGEGEQWFTYFTTAEPLSASVQPFTAWCRSREMIYVKAREAYVATLARLISRVYLMTQYGNVLYPSTDVPLNAYWLSRVRDVDMRSHPRIHEIR